MKIAQHLMKALRDAAVHNPEVQVAPACILWPDRDRQWEAVVPLIQVEMPELLILGNYEPARRTGPAMWLRCAIAGKADEVSLTDNETPIIYLPGVSRQDLRAVESCPDHLKPLAELQYRGTTWTQMNGKDWTVLAFLKSDQGGLGLDVAQDRGTAASMRIALHRFLDGDLEPLKGKHLDKDFFYTLLAGDPIRNLLQWLDQGETFRGVQGDNEWQGFAEYCKSNLAFNPDRDGILAGAAKLAAHEGPWGKVWDRFCDAPKKYPGIPSLIRKCVIPDLPPLLRSAAALRGWPQWNDAEEVSLRNALQTLSALPAHEAREKIGFLENRHRERRQLVWAELDESPLACALEHLATLAEVTSHSLCTGSVSDLSEGYGASGWKADDAVLRALASVVRNVDLEAVSTAIRSVYLPWAEESARHLQKIVDSDGYPGGPVGDKNGLSPSKGECFLFVDGLRFDVARRLEDMCLQQGHHVEEIPSWAALPTVTATGKPAVSPIRDKIAGTEANADFEPCIAESRQSLKGGHHFKKQLALAGWQVLDKSESGNGVGNAWCVFGNIDHEGHEQGWKLAGHLDGMLHEIVGRVEQLLGAGWNSVRIVTDHGWLLVPGGLPKIDLESTLVEHKWGRCAAVKAGAVTDERLFPWYWNPQRSVALANGISCYRAGEEYAHGGLSLQECLKLELIVMKGEGLVSADVVIAEVIWKGLRCSVSVDGEFSILHLDVRLLPGDSTSSLVQNAKAKPFKDNGTTSVVMRDDEFEGATGFIVLIDEHGALVAQAGTVIGGDGT